jgi:hypothetical protein
MPAKECRNWLKRHRRAIFLLSDSRWLARGCFFAPCRAEALGLVGASDRAPGCDLAPAFHVYVGTDPKEKIARRTEVTGSDKGTL